MTSKGCGGGFSGGGEVAVGGVQDGSVEKKRKRRKIYIYIF